MRGIIWFWILLGIVAIPLGAQELQQPPLVFRTISVPGAQETDIYGISFQTDILVGDYIDQQGVQHGLIMRGSHGSSVDDPNGTNTVCTSVSTRGGCVGYYTTPSGNTQAFSWDGENFKDIGPPDAVSSVANGIGPLGSIVGAYTTTVGGRWHGFYLSGPDYTTLDAPGATDTWAYGVSQNAYTLIWLDTNGRYHSSFCREMCKTIDVPGAVNTFAHGMDVHNNVALSWQDAQSNFHGALLRGHNFYKFDVPNGTNTQAYGVNVHYVVGQYLPSGSTIPASFGGASCPPLCK